MYTHTHQSSPKAKVVSNWLYASQIPTNLGDGRSKLSYFDSQLWQRLLNDSILELDSLSDLAPHQTPYRQQSVRGLFAAQ